MSKKKKTLLSLILILSLIIPAVFCSAADEDRLVNETVRYYKANKTSVTTFWEAAALYGAGVNLKDGSWSLDGLNISSIPANPQPTDYAGVILANLALGKDPKDAVPGMDIVAELKSKQDDTGAFGSIINQHLWAMIALDALNEEYNKEKALNYLESAKLADGGFGYNAAASDVDLTAMALVALSSCMGEKKADELISGAVGFLKSAQLQSGGFSSWGVENPNTIAAVISGLSSVGENITSSSWKKDGNSMLDALLKFKLDNGSYTFSLDAPETDSMVTEQVLVALCDAANTKSVWSRLISPSTVNVRIEGISSTILNGSVSVKKISPKVIDAIKKILIDSNIEYIINNGYISSVNREAEKAFGGYDGWLFLINGESASVGMNSCAIKDSDEIVLYYGDFCNTKIAKYTILTDTPRAGSDIKIKVTGDYFDLNGNKHTDEEIEGVSVKFGDKTYLTNKNGIAVIDDIKDDGTYKVIISMDQQGSYPAIVRIPSFEVKVLKEKTSSGSGPKSGNHPIVIAPTPAPAATQPPVATPPPPAADYKDEAEISAWASQSVVKARELGIAAGNDKGYLEPQKSVTRAEFTAMLIRLLKMELTDEQPQYSDIMPNDWHTKYVTAAKKLNLISGYDDNTFRPNNTITREEMAVIISRAFNFGEGSLTFSDKDQISPWAADAASKLSTNGIITGFDGKFAPKDNVTKEMAVVVIIRLKEAFLK